MVMNPVDRIQTVWIRPDPDFAGSSYFRIRIVPDPEKNTGYPARSGSGSRSGAPLMPLNGHVTGKGT